MKSLFIIGNGFDIAHGLKTSYEDFRQYLINEYPDATDDNYDYTIPESSTDGHGGEVYNEDEVISLLLHLISEALILFRYYGTCFVKVLILFRYVSLLLCFVSLKRSFCFVILRKMRRVSLNNETNGG